VWPTKVRTVRCLNLGKNVSYRPQIFYQLYGAGPFLRTYCFHKSLTTSRFMEPTLHHHLCLATCYMAYHPDKYSLHTPHFFKTRLNIILTPTPKSTEWFSLSGLAIKILTVRQPRTTHCIITNLSQWQVTWGKADSKPQRSKTGFLLQTQNDQTTDS
jgi:hypothetical protein